MNMTDICDMESCTASSTRPTTVWRLSLRASRTAWIAAVAAFDAAISFCLHSISSKFRFLFCNASWSSRLASATSRQRSSATVVSRWANSPSNRAEPCHFSREHRLPDWIRFFLRKYQKHEQASSWLAVGPLLVRALHNKLNYFFVFFWVNSLKSNT